MINHCIKKKYIKYCELSESIYSKHEFVILDLLTTVVLVYISSMYILTYGNFEKNTRLISRFFIILYTMCLIYNVKIDAVINIFAFFLPLNYIFRNNTEY